MKRTSIMMASLAGIMACALLPGTAMAAGDAAQDAPADAPAKAQDAPAQDGNAIVVTGLRASLRDALQAKRINTLVVDTISSKDIGALPDITIADELNRLPGVNASRDRGNDSQASVRGLGPRLVLGLVNGREVATSEPDRNVRWEIYPSEDVSAVTVYKSQDASLIDGGVAATIDIRTLRPLDYVGSPLTVRAGAQYNDGGKDIPGYSRWGTRGSLQYVAKLTDTFALAAGGSYQQQRNGKNRRSARAANQPVRAQHDQVQSSFGLLLARTDGLHRHRRYRARLRLAQQCGAVHERASFSRHQRDR